MTSELNCRGGPLDGVLLVPSGWPREPWVVVFGSGFGRIFPIDGVLPTGFYHLYVPLKDEWLYCGVKDKVYLQELVRCRHGAA